MTLGNSKIQQLTDKSVGKCLSSFYEETAASPAEGDHSVTIARKVATVVRKSTRAKDTYLEVLKHNIDAAFAWMIGIIAGVQDVVQSIDMGSCKLPDFYMQDVFRCTCGDTAYRIPSYRAQESSLWCTGTLRMLAHGTQQSTIVYNPYSLAQILDKLSQNAGLERYLECISTGVVPEGVQGCDPLLPRIPEFDRQGVSSIAVLSRYVHMAEGALSLSLSLHQFRPVVVGKNPPHLPVN